MRIIETESYKLITAGWFNSLFPQQGGQGQATQPKPNLQNKIKEVKERITRLQTLKNIAKNNKDIAEMKRLDGLIESLFMTQQDLLEQQYAVA